jgi:helicase
MDVNDLHAFGAASGVVQLISSLGIKELYPPQAAALTSGLLQTKDSFLVTAPTASGKTLIGEMAALQACFEASGKVIYLVPLRALAREKYEDFSKKYGAKGLKIVQSTGDYDSAEPWLQQGDILIATNEKMDSLVRHRARWLRELSVVVADEIHLLRDPQRGPTLEVVLTRLRSLNPSLRVIGLSATLPNGREIGQWLGAKLIESEWRPVPLREGVYSNGAVIFHEGTVRWISEDAGIDAVDLAVDTVKEGGQALIFANTRKATESVALKSSDAVSALLSPDERESLQKMSEEVLGASAEPTRICRRLAEAVKSGVAFHHAGIISAQRALIEDQFRRNRIKCIVATTTLAMGLNLPSRRVIIRDWWRYESGRGMQPIPAIEIKQMGGRAGRPHLDAYGEAILIARNKREEIFLFENYIRGRLEKIDSQLGNESSLRTHILASVAAAFTRTRPELVDFLGKTLFAHQQGTVYLFSLAKDILHFLEEEGMVISERGALKATRFGHRVSELYIDPLTGVFLRNSLQDPREKNVFPLLHMVTRTPDMMTLSLRKKDRDAMVELFYERADFLLIPEEEKYPTDEMLSQLKTASALMDWVLETPEDAIVGRYGIGPGDLRSLVDLADWLLYSASEIARLFHMKESVRAISQLRIQVGYGVKEELLELVSLRGIGRIRARSLYNAGFRGLKEIREASVAGLASLPGIGKTLADEIKQQARTKRGKRGSKEEETPAGAERP